jgi:hypothetical protein
LTEIPAVFLLYESAAWSGVFLLLIFGVSVWNGGGFYIEVFGRKFVAIRCSARNYQLIHVLIPAGLSESLKLCEKSWLRFLHALQVPLRLSIMS